MSNLKPFTVHFPGDAQATAVRVDPNANPAAIAGALQLPHPTRVLMLSAGAGKMSPDAANRLRLTFEALAKSLSRQGITVIDGGTQSGGMQLMGEALAKMARTAPLIGVLPAYAEIDDQGTQGQDVLEPNHSHFVLLNAKSWGDEVPTMSALVTYLSAGAGAATLLVNGGQIALHDIRQSVQDDRPVVALAGSGRLADELADAMRHRGKDMRPPVAMLAQSGKVAVCNLSESADELIEMLFERMK